MITRQLKLKILYSLTFHRQTLIKYFHPHGHHLFDKTPKPPLISIHHSMLNYLRDNDKRAALNIFKNQLQLGLSEIDEGAVAIALKACCGDPKFGVQIHALSVKAGLECFLSVPNSLMNMYSKSGQFDLALCIFRKLENPDTVSYNTVLSGFENGEEALHFAHKMQLNSVVFDPVSFTKVLAHCADYKEFGLGIQLHCNILKVGLEKEVFIGNALVTLYSKWGKTIEAERVFYGMPYKDIVSWNALISGYVQVGGYGIEAILGFAEMARMGLKLDHVSFTHAISACGHEKNLEIGRQIHGLAIKRRYSTHVSVCNVLLSMYIKCDFVNVAKLVFKNMSDRNVISWTTMLSANEENAMRLFNEMRRDEVYPNDVTMVVLIHAVTLNNMVLEGLTVHSLCIKAGFLFELNVANSFVTMYAKFGYTQDSLKIFEELDYREIVSWNALISGYAQNGMHLEALQVFVSALKETRPNEYTFGSVLSAIASSESISLRHGQRCHSYLLKLGLDVDPIVLGALLDMYAKRGSICESQRIFCEMAERSHVAWTTIISAYARHGDYESVMCLFEEMIQRGIKPDSITFLSVLTACGRKGMVDTGIKIFNSMVEDHSIEPSSEHYSCKVDMLGRAGRLKEAEEFIDQIPGGPGLSVLQSLLGACRIYGNVDIATRVTDALTEMEPNESGSYVLMSNLFAEKGQWERAAKIRKGMRDKGVKKQVGFSWVDVGRVADSLCLHAFSSDDKTHPQYEEIYRMAELLGSEMKFLEKGERGNLRLRIDELENFERLI